jgi:MazG family protein
MTDHRGDIEQLLKVMAKLRDPNGGCPWDLEQTFATIAPYTIEEAYEVAEAIAHNDMAALKDELGDLLFQAVYHAQMASEQGAFDFADVVAAITDKMIRRHPHVFGDARVDTADAQTKAWEDMKAKERAAKQQTSILDGVSQALPALTRAVKLQKRASRVGFDWHDVRPVLAKLREEIDELEAEIKADAPTTAIEEEFGDMLFVMANLARHLNFDPEQALRSANAKFERRFKAIEERLAARGVKPEDCTLSELDAEWNAVKQAEKKKKP